MKIASHVKEKPRDLRNQSDQHTTMTAWLGADCPVDFLNVWFPAHWSPIVFRELHEREVKYRREHTLWFDAPALASDTARLTNQRKDAVRSRDMHFHLGAMDQENELPTLIGKLKIDWLDFPVDDILQQFTTLKEGILRGVFKQKAARAWFGCRAEKAQITVLLPGSCSLSEWTDKVDCITAGQRPLTLAGCRWARCKQKLSTYTENSREPGICGSHYAPTGGCWLHICTQTGQVYIPMRKSMTDSSSILEEMTISMIRRLRRSGTRLPIFTGSASNNTCGNSSMHRFHLSESQCNKPLPNATLTC